MSSTYTGDAGNITPGNAVEITEPADGDALNASSVNAALDTLTDYAAFLKRAAYDGTRSVVKLDVDGVGNQATAGAVGTITANSEIKSNGGPLTSGGSISSGTPGAGQAVPLGSVYKDTAAVAWCYVEVAAGARSFKRGANIASTTYQGLGIVDVVLTNCPANYLAPIACVTDAGGGFAYCTFNVGTKTITVNTTSDTGAAVDRNFSLVVFGG